MNPRVRKRLNQLIMGLWAFAIVGCLGLSVGCYIDDHTIAADPGRALARVTNTSGARTTVDFRDEQGVYRSPPNGLLYPTGLSENQLVYVTYAKSNPNLVKVESRAWTLSLIPAASLMLASTLIAAALFAAVAWANTALRRRAEAAAAARHPKH